MSGCFEGSSDQGLSIISGCNEALGDDHPRVVTLIVVDYFNDQNNGAPHGPLDGSTVRRLSPILTERNSAMREVQVTLPELGLLVGTRAALGAGLGLLLADCLPESQRKAVGWTLLLVGAFTTVPLAFEVLGKVRAPTPPRLP
jgi:hypothetical protein